MDELWPSTIVATNTHRHSVRNRILCNAQGIQIYCQHKVNSIFWLENRYDYMKKSHRKSGICWGLDTITNSSKNRPFLVAKKETFKLSRSTLINFNAYTIELQVSYISVLNNILKCSVILGLDRKRKKFGKYHISIKIEPVFGISKIERFPIYNWQIFNVFKSIFYARYPFHPV